MIHYFGMTLSKILWKIKIFKWKKNFKNQNKNQNKAEKKQNIWIQA